MCLTLELSDGALYALRQSQEWASLPMVKGQYEREFWWQIQRDRERREQEEK